MDARKPRNEVLRLEALHSYDVLDSAAEQAYDDIAKLASYICDAPMALITLIDEDRQWFKARVGVDVLQTPRGDAFCTHAILDPQEVMQVHDTSLDPRFSNNPLVTGDPNIRFYAGAPLVTSTGAALGTVCVADRVPRKLEPRMVDALKALSRQVVSLLQLRHALSELKLLSDVQQHRQKQLEGHQKRLEDLNLVLVEQNTTDPLTGLKNRRAFDRILNEESSRTERSHSSLALAIIDVDHFKSFNDEFGHVAGDEALQQVSLMLQSHARAYDHAARYGGEEFAVILPDTRIDACMVVAERIRRAVQEFDWRHRPITVSVGVAVATSSNGALNLVERADKALYEAKRKGRNCVVHLGEADAIGIAQAGDAAVFVP